MCSRYVILRRYVTLILMGEYLHESMLLRTCTYSCNGFLPQSIAIDPYYSPSKISMIIESQMYMYVEAYMYMSAYIHGSLVE